MKAIYIENDNAFEVQGLTSSVSGDIDEGATVTLTLKRRDGTEVAGQSWPVTLDHVAGGTYRANLSHSLELQHLHVYIAEVSGIGSDGEVYKARCKITALNRGCK